MLLQPTESTKTASFIQDAARVILANRFVVETAPLQTYCTAIVFAPEKALPEAYSDPLYQNKYRG